MGHMTNRSVIRTNRHDESFWGAGQHVPSGDQKSVLILDGEAEHSMPAFKHPYRAVRKDYPCTDVRS